MATKTIFGQPIGGSATSGSSVNPQLGQNYQGLLDANPYVGINRKQKWWEPAAAWLGIRTPTEKWQEQMQLQANEYNAQIAQQAYAENYNSPTQEAARMRAAGINPDLAGGLSPGEAQTPGQDPSIPTFDDTTGPNMFRSIGEGLMNCITSAIGLVDSFGSMVMKSNEASLSGLKNRMSANSLFDNWYRSLLPSSPGDIVEYDDGSVRTVPIGSPVADNEVYRQDWKTAFLTRAESAIGTLPKKYRRKAMQRLAEFHNSAPQTEEAWKQWAQSSTNRSSYNSNQDNLFTAASGVMSDISSELQSLRKEIIETTVKSQISDLNLNVKENQNRSDYLEKFDAGLEGESHNAKNTVDKANNEMLGIMRSSLDKIVKKLEQRTHASGLEGTFAECVLVMVSLLQLQMTSSSSPLISTSRKEFNTIYNDSYTRLNGKIGEIY